MNKIYLLLVFIIITKGLCFSQKNKFDHWKVENCFSNDKYNFKKQELDNRVSPFKEITSKRKVDYYNIKLNSRVGYFVIDNENTAKYFIVRCYQFESSKISKKCYKNILGRKKKEINENSINGKFWYTLEFFQYENYLFEITYNNIDREHFDKYVKAFKSCIESK